MRLTRPILLPVVAVLAACSLDDKLVGPNPLTGEGLVYTLIEVNAKAVPVTTSSGPPTIEVLRGALTLSTDSSWIVSLVSRVTRDGRSVASMTTTRGRYARANAALRLTVRDDTVTAYTGSWSALAVLLAEGPTAAGNRYAFARSP